MSTESHDTLPKSERVHWRPFRIKQKLALDKLGQGLGTSCNFS